MDRDTLEATVDLAMPASAWAFVDEQVAAGSFAGREEYIARLIEDARARRDDEARLEQALLDGINSSPATPWTERDRDEILRKLGPRPAADRPQ